MYKMFIDPNAWLTFSMLIMLEIILGLDNIIFLSLIVEKLPKTQQHKAQRLGLTLAMLARLLLLGSITWVIRLTHPLFKIMAHSVSIRDLILLFGGLFLIWKVSKEIYYTIKNSHEEKHTQAYSFFGSIIQIILLDVIFSLDSVITAVGLSDNVLIMMAAVMTAISIMMYAARAISEFVNRHKSVKVLALAFLILVGSTLILESLTVHAPKGYMYFAMFFSIVVEILNMVRTNKE
ncbi:TerC family protein [Candidatus Gillettellia adelgis]